MRASSVDVEKLAAILRDAARTEILPRFRQLDPAMVRQKTSAVDLVTEADEEAEQAIKAAVAALAPDALFVGEESVAADPALLGELAGADLAVVVDPIDGTANYAAGTPLFGVMAAVVSKGETVAGIIYDPMGDDWFVAEKGGGAWFMRPDGRRTRLAVAAPVPLHQMVGVAPLSLLARDARQRAVANLSKVAVVSAYRCAAHEYRMVTSGHIHFAMFVKLMPWDHLAGALIAAEAGAYLARLDGSAYLPQHTSGGLLVAPDRESWRELKAEVLGPVLSYR